MEPLRPVLYFIHGGGLIAGSNRSSMRAVLDIAQESGLAVVSAEYRLAPEHPYPAAVDDCFAGLEWTAAHAAEVGTDPGRVLLCGASAGGGLAPAVALLARDRKGLAVAAQMLICPMLDHRNDTPSSHQMASQPFWNRQANDTGWTAYLPGRDHGEDISPYASPTSAGDLSGVPPAYLDVGTVDTFRDEVIAYPDGLWRAGGDAELHVWSGGYHGFEQLLPQSALAHEARTARVNWLRRQLTSATQST